MLKTKNILKRLPKSKKKREPQSEKAAQQSASGAVVYHKEKKPKMSTKKRIIVGFSIVIGILVLLSVVNMAKDMLERRNYKPSQEQQLINEFKPEATEILRHDTEE